MAHLIAFVFLANISRVTINCLKKKSDLASCGQSHDTGLSQLPAQGRLFITYVAPNNIKNDDIQLFKCFEWVIFSQSLMQFAVIWSLI